MLIWTGSGSTYTLHARFQDAGGLVAGNQIFIGPAAVGTVKSITLSPDGGADVTMQIDAADGPLRQGTVARIYENSLSGVANKYVVLEPTSDVAPPIPDGGSIPPQNAYSPVGLDQLFDALNAPARKGLDGFIRGEAQSIQGRAKEANQTLQYFAPALASTSQVTRELARDEASFDGLLVQGAQTLQGLATRTQQLSALVADTAATTGAIASRAADLERALGTGPGRAEPLDPDVRRSAANTRRARPVRRRVQGLLRAPEAVQRGAAALHPGLGADGRPARRADPQPDGPG